MDIAISIIGAILVIFVVILIHELGHFAVAKWSGVTVERFSIGFGRPIWLHRAKSGTEYALGILPFGGYVKMLGEGDTDVPLADASGAYNRKSVWTRMAIVLAGPFMNFLLAVFMFWIIFMLGITTIKPVVGQVIPNSVAATAGMKSGDAIVKVGRIHTRSWQRIVMSLIGHVGSHRDLSMTVQPPQSEQLKTLQLDLRQWQLDPVKPDFLTSLGIKPFRPDYPAIIAKVFPKSAAARAGMRVGDHIVAFDGQPVKDMMALVERVKSQPGRKATVTVVRNGKRLVLSAVVGKREVEGKQIGFLGFLAKPPKWPKGMVERMQYSPIGAFGVASREVATLTWFHVIVLRKMFVGDISVRTLGGPITIFHSAGKASHGGWRVYLGFIAFISIALGFINLLPIPGLDGGHFVFYVIEAVTRRPVPERIQSWAIKIGIVLLIMLMIFATMNDVLRLF